MSWSFTIYGIKAAKFEEACFYLLLKYGFTLDQCTGYATLFQREDRLQTWYNLHDALAPHIHRNWTEAYDILGIHEFGEFAWMQNKDTNFGLNKITLWYLNRFSHLSPNPIVPYRNGCFIADKATNDAIIDRVTTAIAFVEQQSNEGFVWEHWDVEFNQALLPTVKEYFGETGWQAAEYRYVFQQFYHQLRSLLREDHDWFYWEHSY